jgi:hypothetical protein
MQEGPKLQTFYTCKDEKSKCTNLYEEQDIDYNYFQCKLLNHSFDGSSCLTLEDTEFIKTPIDCPLLGKAQEYDVRFDKDVLMRNL